MSSDGIDARLDSCAATLPVCVAINMIWIPVNRIHLVRSIVDDMATATKLYVEFQTTQKSKTSTNETTAEM